MFLVKSTYIVWYEGHRNPVLSILLNELCMVLNYRYLVKPQSYVCIVSTKLIACHLNKGIVGDVCINGVCVCVCVRKVLAFYSGHVRYLFGSSV